MEQHLLRAFAGLINQLRQNAMGFSHYIWRSSDDDKVRASHAAHDDRLFSWDDPPEGGHPGQAWGCRCHAEPFVLGLSPGHADPQDDPIGYIDAFLSPYQPGISAGTGVRPREAVLDYLMPPEPGVTINGEMLGVQAQGDLATSFLNLDRAIKEDPARFLAMLARHGGDFTTLSQAFGRAAPENFAVAALLAASGAPEAEVDSALTATRGLTDRLIGGTATALGDLAGSIRALPELRWSDIRLAIAQIYQDPSVLPEAMVAPFRERIARGDYAGALGYGLPEVLAGLAGLAGLRGRAAELSGPLSITREMLDAGGKIEGFHNAGLYAPRFDKWTDRGGQVQMTPDGHFSYTIELDVFGTRQRVTVTYRNGSPDFAPFMRHPSGVRAVEIEMTGGYPTDFRRANIAAGHPEWGSRPPSGWTWHHVEDGQTMQLVPWVINDEFGHEGGAALIRRSEN